MPTDPLRVLIIDDSTADARLLRSLMELTTLGKIEVVHCTTTDLGMELLMSDEFDCLLLDYRLDETDGLEILKAIRQAGNDIPIVAISGCGNEYVAVEAMKLGAQDYLVKGAITPETMECALVNAIEKVSLTRQLAEQRRELDDFVNIAAHDLRAPLRTINSFARILQEEIADITKPEAIETIQRIERGSERMSRLLDALLEYSRVGRSETTLLPVDLREVVASLLQALETQLQESDAQIEFSELPTVMGDSIALGQLFQNLVCNSIKFCRERTPHIRIDAQENEDRWLLSLADNGIGVDPEHHERIFAPFHRLHTQKDFEGSGIGLATCKRIVDQHGGRIWLESKLHFGTTFFFTLPKVYEPRDADALASLPAASPKALISHGSPA